MTGPDYESLSRGISSDMSPEAITRRLDVASQLYRLARTLSKAEYVGPVESLDDLLDGRSEVREPGPEHEDA